MDEDFTGEEVPEGRDERLPERPLRWQPYGKPALYEVTTRTLGGNFFLRPDRDCVEIVDGVLGRALHKFPKIGLVAYWFLSNHFNLLTLAPNAHELSGFMNHVNSNIARKLGRLRGQRERFWSRRYRAIIVGPGRWIQVNRLKYLIAQGTKENLVGSPAQWPGANCLRALTEGAPRVGTWFDDSAAYRARKRGENPKRYDHAEKYPITLVPLPCWEGFSPKERQARAREVVAEVEKEASAARRASGRRPLGVQAVLAQDPHDHPAQSSRSPAPLSHGNRAERQWFKNLYWKFVRAFRQASARLREGILEAIDEFPAGCFLPRFPFHVRRRFGSSTTDRPTAQHA